MRSVYCTDALPWLKEGRSSAPGGGVGAYITSLPDMAEVGLAVDAWRQWFFVAAREVMRAAAPDAPAIFYQTDRKLDGELVSKASILLQAGQAAGMRLLWHKIVLRRAVGGVDLHRPGYSHMLAFSRSGRPGPATPDVLSAGGLLYPNGMGLAAARVAVELAARSSRLVVDPFCGRGTVLAVAESLGLDALGVDIDPEQCRHAESLTVTLPDRDLVRA